MKNILYISPFTYIGGGEISLLILLKNLDHQMVRPFLICYAEGPLVQKAKKLGIKSAVLKRNYLFSSIFIVLKIFSYIKKNSIHLVHVNCFDIRAGIAARLARVPLIGHLRVIIPFTWRDRLFVRLSQKVIAVSNAVIDTFCRGRPSYRDKFEMIPNAVEIPNSLTPVPLRKEYDIPEDTKLVGSVGRIDPWKGYEYFSRAAALIKKQRSDVFFFIIGDVSQRDREGRAYLDILKKQAAELDLKDRLFFTGFREDILKVIKTLDILVVPSIVIKKYGGEVTEGFGRVAIEAMAVEVPVVASKIGGLTEIIEDNVFGMLVPPGNPNAIAEAVLSILTDKIKAKAMGKAGRKRVEESFTIQQHADKIKKLYLEILKERYEQKCR